MAKIISLLLLVVGLINFLPVLGVLSAAKLSQAYAIDLVGDDIVILMRHRALLFGILGGFIIYSVFVPAYQGAAMVMAGIAMIGFLFFMWQQGESNAALYKVMLVDVVGIVCLMVAAGLKYLVGVGS